MANQTPEDHRTRVAASRREKTRTRLIESAILVFAEKGVDSPVIDDVIEAAGVARGTFYNYFQSNRELLVAVNEQLANELITLVEQKITNIPDPAERIATGIGLFVEIARQNPLLARFIAQIGFDVAGPNSQIYSYLPGHLQDGIDSGCFMDIPLDVALDFMTGTMLFTMFRSGHDQLRDDHGPAMVATLLRGLGVDPARAKALAAQPLPPMDISAACLMTRSKAMAALAADPDRD